MGNFEPADVLNRDALGRDASWKTGGSLPALAVLALLLAAPWLDASQGEQATWSGASRLAVTTLELGGEPLAGVTLSLCSFESGRVHARGRDDGECRAEVSDSEGSAVFDPVPPGKYRLTGALEGFADTSVFPLHVGSSKDGPMAPDRVTVLLNPVCWDC